MLKNSILALFLCTCCLAISAALAADTGKVTVHVTGLRNDKGVVRFALFNSKDSYSADKNTADLAYKKDVAPINVSETAYTFKDVPYGEYAIKLYHDEANSGKFIVGKFGIPKVEYAFSNNARGLFGPASYDKAKFKLSSASLNMDIKMIQ